MSANSTEINEGFNLNKPSSRVLRPPGGGSSNIFGTEPSYATNNNDAKKADSKNEPEANYSSIKSKMTTSNVFGGAEESPNPPTPAKKPEEGEQEEEQEEKKEEENGVEKPEENSENPVENSEKSEEAAEASKGQKGRGSFNPITGEEYTKSPEKPMHTSTKVRQPPGGASSGLW